MRVPRRDDTAQQYLTAEKHGTTNGSKGTEDAGQHGQLVIEHTRCLLVAVHRTQRAQGEKRRKEAAHERPDEHPALVQAERVLLQLGVALGGGDSSAKAVEVRDWHEQPQRVGKEAAWPVEKERRESQQRLARLMLRHPPWVPTGHGERSGELRLHRP
jgi:hypothetical protein